MQPYYVNVIGPTQLPQTYFPPKNVTIDLAAPIEKAPSLGFLDRLAFGNQWDQLNDKGNRELLRFGETFIKERCVNLLKHIAETSTLAKIWIVVQKFFNTFRIVRHLINAFLIHPLVGQQDKKLFTSNRITIHEDMTKGITQPISFFTEDHVQLEGVMIHPTGDQYNWKQRPCMVFALGNYQLYEEMYTEAQGYAEKYDVNVVLYSPRGVSCSLGHEYTTQDAVKDCKAAIKFALKEVNNDAARLAVQGFSLGGGLSATALKELQQEKVISEEGIGLYANLHSFSSISDFMAGQMNVQNWLIRKIFAAIVSLIGLNNLNSLDAVMNYQLAQKVIVSIAKRDEVMLGIGSLGEALKAHNKKPIEILEFNSDHCESRQYRPHFTHLKGPSENYRNAFETWAQNHQEIV